MLRIISSFVFIVCAGSAVKAEPVATNPLPDSAFHLQDARAPAFKARAETWALKGQCELAVADYTRSIELDPRQPTVYLDRGSCYRSLGLYDLAAKDLTLVLRFDPRSADAFRLRAHVRIAQGELSAAVTDLRWAADIEPRDVKLMSMLGIARYAMGDYEIAANSLARSLRFRDDIQAMLFLYLARTRNGEDGSKDLERQASFLRSRAWPYPVVSLFLGRSHQQAVLAAATDETSQCTARFYIGQWLHLTGRRPEATAILNAAAQTCPKSLLEYEVARAQLLRLVK